MTDEVEVWRPVKGFEGLYEVSNLGRVRSWVNNAGNPRFEPKILEPSKTRNGYLYVCLCKNGKRTKKRVHRLVAEAFLPNPLHLPMVNHRNELKDDNCVENLEFCDAKYNSNFGTAKERSAKAHSKVILQLDLEGNLIKEWSSLADVHRKTCWSQGSISMACHGKRRIAYGFIWEYAD